MALVFMYLMSVGILDWFCHVMMEMLFVCREWEGERNLDRQTDTERERERERENVLCIMLVIIRYDFLEGKVESFVFIFFKVIS